MPKAARVYISINQRPFIALTSNGGYFLAAADHYANLGECTQLNPSNWAIGCWIKDREWNLDERLRVDNLIKIFCFDIDGTICTNTDGDYLNAKPHVQRIQHLNRLHHAGHTIKLFTARGSSTGFDWREVTTQQLAQWEVNYHELIMGKPHADLFIDDKSVHSETYRWD